MLIPLYQVDAFTDEVFKGNPAAVCPLEKWLTDAQLQAIANENNLSETAFFVFDGLKYRLRWFTPAAEVNLCGHATLATAHVIFTYLDPFAENLCFSTLSGDLYVRQDKNDLLIMDFPIQPCKEICVGNLITEGLGSKPSYLFDGQDVMAVFDHEIQVRDIVPNHAVLSQFPNRGVIITAPGKEVDIVSRFFAPKLDVPEDPVTGSAHCMLTPYWANRLGKTTLRARQISSRGGELWCTLNGERVILSGKAVQYMRGHIKL